MFAIPDCNGVTLVAVAYQLNIGAVNPFTSKVSCAPLRSDRPNSLRTFSIRIFLISEGIPKYPEAKYKIL